MSICLTTFQLGQIVTDAKIALSKAKAGDRETIIAEAEQAAIKLVGKPAAKLALACLSEESL